MRKAKIKKVTPLQQATLRAIEALALQIRGGVSVAVDNKESLLYRTDTISELIGDLTDYRLLLEAHHAKH